MNIGHATQTNLISLDNCHKQSKASGLNRKDLRVKDCLSQKDLVALFRHKNTLIKTTEPFLHKLYQLVEGTDFFLELLDEHGTILYMIGDDHILKQVHMAGMDIGTSMKLSSAGTNAISVAKALECPCQLMGDDHYLEIFHPFTCSCAPIRDSNNAIIGFINLNGYSNNAHTHTLGLVVAAVDAIQNQLLYEATLSQIDYANRVTNSLIESIDFGVLTIDDQGKIIFINSFAQKLLNDFTTTDHYIYDYFLGKTLKERILRSNEFHNDHFILKSSGDEIIFDSHYIIEQDGNPNGFVIILKTIDSVLNIASRYINLKAKTTFQDLIAGDIKTINLIRFAKKIANSPSFVLISGEPGTGKTSFAEAIHNESHRSTLPFITIDCRNTNNTDLLYELFGSNEGSPYSAEFTGKMNASLSGTILLKNIEHMSLAIQGQLLDYLRSKKSDETRQISRLISTTNISLEEAVSDGLFDIELFYELCVIPIKLPPLRQRPNDIKTLLEHLITHKSKSLNQPPISLTNKVRHTLMSYKYPGNIHELESIVERLINLKGQLDYSLMVEDMTSNDGNIDICALTLENLEALSIKRNLELNDYNYSSTAKKLGISRSTLYNKLKKINTKHKSN